MMHSLQSPGGGTLNGFSSDSIGSWSFSSIYCIICFADSFGSSASFNFFNCSSNLFCSSKALFNLSRRDPPPRGMIDV